VTKEKKRIVCPLYGKSLLSSCNLKRKILYYYKFYFYDSTLFDKEEEKVWEPFQIKVINNPQIERKDKESFLRFVKNLSPLAFGGRCLLGASYV